MKKIFYLLSTLGLILVSMTSFFWFKRYLGSENQAYYYYLTILIYLTMVIPLYLLLVLTIKEAKKIEPSLPINISTGLFIYIALGVIIFQLVVNFIGTKYFSFWQIPSYLFILVDFIGSVVATYLISKVSKNDSGVKIVKK